WPRIAPTARYQSNGARQCGCHDVTKPVPNGTLHIRHIKLWLRDINAQPRSKLNLLTQRSIAAQTNTALGLQTEDRDLCQKKQPSIITGPRNIIRMPRIITVK